MRVATVLGAIGVGLGLGSAAVLAPLMMGGGGTKVETPQSAPFGSQWSENASRIASVELKASDAPPLPSNATPADTVADARIVLSPWKAQVTVATEGTAKRLTSSKPSSDEQRHTLVRDLQIELKRVGCYDGEPNGQWGAASKKAMSAFTDRVNASLPYEQPDFILLTLVQGHKGRACGQDCPTGQSVASNGRCTPNSILAQSERTKQADASKRDAVAAVATAAATTVAAAKLSDTKQQRERTSIASSWTTTTRSAPVETGSITAAVPPPVRVTRPQAPADTPLVKLQPQIAITAAVQPEQQARPTVILPGRMAIGAPVPAPSETATTTSSSTIKPATRMAAVDAGTPTQPVSDPVTTAQPTPEAAVRARNDTRLRRPIQREHAAPRYQSPPQVRHAPEPVFVRRPPPPPRYYAPSPPQKVASGSRSRRMIYDLFQNPNNRN